MQNCVLSDATVVTEIVSSLSNSTRSASSNNDTGLLGRSVQCLIDQEIESNTA